MQRNTRRCCGACAVEVGNCKAIWSVPSSQQAASSSNYLKSVEAISDELEIGLNVIPDWSCCSASIGCTGGGELPRLVQSARNIALSKRHNPG